MAPVSLPASLSDWPPDACEDLEERAAILEHERNMSREDAERVAAGIVRRDLNTR